MKEICDKCGKKKTWYFLSVKNGNSWHCDCEVDLDGATVLPRGMSSFLDERMGWIEEILQDATTK